MYLQLLCLVHYTFQQWTSNFTTHPTSARHAPPKVYTLNGLSMPNIMLSSEKLAASRDSLSCNIRAKAQEAEEENLVFLVLDQKIARCIVTHEPEWVEAEDEGQIARQKQQREWRIKRREVAVQ